MNLVSVIADFFNNASVSAFLGAAAAFLLVYLTDRRRTAKRRTTLRKVLSGTLTLAAQQHQSVAANRDLLRDRDTLHPGRVQRFPVNRIEALLLDVYDTLPELERSSMETLVFRMRAIDSLLEGSQTFAERLYQLYIDKEVGSEAQKLKRRLLIDYEAVLTNLKHLCELGEMFLKGDYVAMTNWRFTPKPSELIPS